MCGSCGPHSFSGGVLIMSTNLLPRPKSYEEGQTIMHRVTGDPRALNKYLTVAITVLAVALIAALSLCVKLTAQQKEKIVVRIDDAGRPLAVGYTVSGYKPQPNEIKYFLAQFVHDYYGRVRSTVRDDFGRSMYFLAEPLAHAVMEDDRRTRGIEKFILSGDDQIEIVIRNIVLNETVKPPYAAQVDIEKIFRNRSGFESKREKYIVGIRFTVTPEVPNNAVLVNPLGFVITSLRHDQAF